MREIILNNIKRRVDMLKFQRENLRSTEDYSHEIIMITHSIVQLLDLECDIITMIDTPVKPHYNNKLFFIFGILAGMCIYFITTLLN